VGSIGGPDLYFFFQNFPVDIGDAWRVRVTIIPSPLSTSTSHTSAFPPTLLLSSSEQKEGRFIVSQKLGFKCHRVKVGWFRSFDAIFPNNNASSRRAEVHTIDHFQTSPVLVA